MLPCKELRWYALCCSYDREVWRRSSGSPRGNRMRPDPYLKRQAHRTTGQSNETGRRFGDAGAGARLSRGDARLPHRHGQPRSSSWIDIVGPAHKADPVAPRRHETRGPHTPIGPTRPGHKQRGKRFIGLLPPFCITPDSTCCSGCEIRNRSAPAEIGHKIFQTV
jgi:hypothetical protein